MISEWAGDSHAGFTRALSRDSPQPERGLGLGAPPTLWLWCFTFGGLVRAELPHTVAAVFLKGETPAEYQLVKR